MKFDLVRSGHNEVERTQRRNFVRKQESVGGRFICSRMKTLSEVKEVEVLKEDADEDGGDENGDRDADVGEKGGKDGVEVEWLENSDSIDDATETKEVFHDDDLFDTETGENLSDCAFYDSVSRNCEGDLWATDWMDGWGLAV